MRQRSIVFIFMAVFFLLFPGFFVAQAETIASFYSDIVIRKDGSIQVTEDIQYDFGTESRHGIFRDIPRIKTNTEGKKYSLGIEVLNVTDQTGKKIPWKDESTTASVRVRIGDPNRTVTGINEYKISYVVKGAVTYFSDHDELYWNVTGNDWEIPIDAGGVTVTLPETIEESLLTVDCFTGISGSDVKHCLLEKKTDGFSGRMTSSLRAQEGFTIVLGFPKNIVAVLEPVEVHSIFDNVFFQLVILLCIAMWYLILPIVFIYRWYRYGRDPKPLLGVTSAWFDPPKTKSVRKLTPGETGTLYDEDADFSDIAGTIVDLARRGFILITETTKKEFTLTKTTPKESDSLQKFESILYEGLFENGDTLELKDAKLITVVEAVKKELYASSVTEGFFYKNPQQVRTIYTVISILAIVTGNILLAISAAIFGRGMVKRTQFGADAKAVAQSLKNFLVSQERQFVYQGDKQLLFERLLPFAVAFGVEKQWAKRFETLNLSQPEWYQSSQSSGFTPSLFVNSLGSSIQSVRSAATPTQSSSGFSSGGSGGFSGGGGGGGGGGSW